jgi:hypothetical protein
MKRMWINQPSTLQPLHSLHGTCVLAAPTSDSFEATTVYFLSGDVVSMAAPKLSLSDGWPVPACKHLNVRFGPFTTTCQDCGHVSNS